MQQANAILAIDSLDRYILAGGIETSGVLSVSWLVATPNILTAVAGIPVIGATLTIGTAAPPPGWPVGVVTITGVVGSQITISTPVTANSGGNQFIIQTFSFNTGTSAAQPRTNALVGNFNRDAPDCNDFSISSPGALIYGYIDKIVVSQIQIQYNIPTVCVGRNDYFHIQWISPGGVNGFGEFQIPYGFYTPTELAAILQVLITTTPVFNPVGLTVSYVLRTGFSFQSNNNYQIYVPDPGVFTTIGYSTDLINRILKTYKMLGLTKENGIRIPISNIPTLQFSTHYPDFLYTPYIDFYSDVLTNYQNVKDTNTSIAKPKGLVARVYLSGNGNLQFQNAGVPASIDPGPPPVVVDVGIPSVALGSEPFYLTADLNSPKVIQWSRDVAVPSIDFQLRDCYGDFIPGVKEKFPTEFQMTLLCIEG
jgi:hypothetical protein